VITLRLSNEEAQAVAYALADVGLVYEDDDDPSVRALFNPLCRVAGRLANAGFDGTFPG
jgi:hypothetical protein